MTNPFYNPTGNPTTGADGLSSVIRGEFAAIGSGFDQMPRITTTGVFNTIFAQLGNFTFTLPSAPGTLAMTSDIAVETARAMAAEGSNATAITTEATTRASAITTEATTRAAADAAETARAIAAELLASGGIGRNRLHNGGFGINQRGYASGSSLGSGIYAHDRWKAGASGCTYTFTQTQPTTVITITAGTLQQIIEALTVEGGTYTLSWAGTATARVNAGSYGASPITITGLPANTAITVEINTGSFGMAQFEPGSAATTFVRRSFRYELAECQRFYCTGNAQLNGYNTAAATLAVTGAFPVTMRATPTLTPTGTGGANFTAFSFLPTLGNGWLLSFNASGTGAASWVGNWTASADL